MIIGEIGNNFPNTQQVSFNSNDTLLEYDALIIDLDFLSGNILNHSDSGRFYKKRLDDLKEFLHYKPIPLIYILPVPQKALIVLNQTQISVDFDFFTPIPKIEVILESGNKINVVPNTVFTDFIEKHKDTFVYRSFFNKNHGTLIAETPLTKKVLGFYTDDCIFIPKVKELNTQQAQSFLKDLIEAAKRVRLSNQPNPLPDWAFDFFLPKEKILNSEIKSAEDQIIALTHKVERLNSESQSYQLKKRLFTATGNDLENEVEAIFKELGLEVLEADRNRDDLIIKFKDKVAVVEIKGVNGSAAEKNAAQLEKWTANYFEKTGISPKGILIVNTFREMELSNRNQPSFPDQMLKYSTQREHCLITAVQLLGLYYEAVSNPTIKEELIESLFSTVGVYVGFQDWQSFIETT